MAALDDLRGAWLGAQQRLAAAATPDWDACAAVIDAADALGRGMGAELPHWHHPLPLGPGLDATEIRQAPAWRWLAEADLKLKLFIAGMWSEACQQAAISPEAPTEAAFGAWATALDGAFARMVAHPGYTEQQTVWLRAALDCGLDLTPACPPMPLAPPLGQSPKDEVWRDGLVSLWRYRGGGELGPLLIVHGVIGRQSVTDLEPQRSLVGDLTRAGADVWTLDWGNPTGAERDLGFTDYAEGWVGQAIQILEAETGRRPALLGICQGGIFVLAQAARHPERVAGIALTGTPVDFHADRGGQEGYLNRLARSLPEDVVDGLISRRGVLPGALTGALFQAMTPGRTFAKYTIGAMRRAREPGALATFARMEAWLADRPDLPARAAREWLISLYRRNALVRGRFEVAGATVELGRITCPVLNIVADHDHIVPPACSRALAEHVPRAPYRLVAVPTGHIGVFVSRKAEAVVAPALADWLGEISRRPDGNRRAI
ncbi:MAG: alpha/beta fold hydrolase [Pseudomonadota bacterium]